MRNYGVLYDLISRHYYTKVMLPCACLCAN